MKRTSFLLIMGIFLLGLAGAYTGYLFWQKSVSDADLKKVEKSLADYTGQVAQFENQQLTRAIAAKRMVNELKVDMIQWSSVIKEIRNTIPKKKGVPLVDVLSYSGSSGTGVSISVKTMPDSTDPYLDVADLIEGFNESDLFVDPFVSSVSAGTDDKGREILNFLFSVRYFTNEAPVAR